MDQNTLVEGGDAGLVAIADAFRATAFPVAAVYLIKRTSVDDRDDWVVRLVLSPFRPDVGRDFLYKFAQLRREKKLPFIDDDVRVNAVPPEDVEASRVLDYARRLGGPPVVIRKAVWDGLYIWSRNTIG
jgi:hypothetical protein